MLGSIAVLVLSALLAAPAAGQTPLVDVPASAAGPVHFSRAGVTRVAGSQNNVTIVHFLSTTRPSAGAVLPVMGRGFGLIAVAVTIPNYPQPNRWFVRGAPSISATNRDELVVVVVGPAGTTPRVFALSDIEQTSATATPPSVNYISSTVWWAGQLHADLNTYPTPSDWTVLVVDKTNPNVDLGALTYTPPAASISSTSPALLTERNLDGAEIALSLTRTTFANGVTADGFALVPAVPGLSVASVAGAASGGTTATLTLAYAAGELPATQELAVRVRTAAHAGDVDLTTGTTITVLGGAVTLADPALTAAAERALGKRPGTLRTADLPALRTLNAGGAGVSSLAGLEAALWLESVSLGGNAPEAGGEPLDLSPLAGLLSLTYLDLSDNALVDISDLSRLTSLRTLLLGGNAVRDLSPLSGLTGLEALTLSGNGLADVSALSTLTALEQLWLDGNDLSDISALSALGALIYLHLGDNRIADISPLAGLSALRRLWLPNNMVADVSALAGLRALTRLDLSRNRIADASPLRGLPRLSWLRLGWNRLAGVSRLAGHPRLADGGALGLRGNPLGATALDTHIPALREAGAAVVFGWAVPLFPSAADAAERSGVVRVLNRSDRDGSVLVEAVDEAGQTAGPVTLPLAAGAAAQFNSADLENSNADMGLAEGVGPPTQGNWRLLLWSVLDIEVLAYVRTPDGFLTAAHAELPRTGDSLSAFLFNPASNHMQRSSLRVFNPGAESARMSVWGVDDAGRGRFASGFMAPPNAPLVLRAGQLERSRGAAGAGLGNGAGKWRLRVAATWPLSASTFLESPSGHLSNLSPPPLRAAAGEMLRLPLFPATSNPAGRVGFARVANMTAAEARWTSKPWTTPASAPARSGCNSRRGRQCTSTPTIWRTATPRRAWHPALARQRRACGAWNCEAAPSRWPPQPTPATPTAS